MEPIFFEIAVDQKDKRVCLIDLPTHQTDWNIERLAEWLVAHHASQLEQTDLLILRPDVGVPLENTDKYADKLPSLARKVPQPAIHMLYSFNFKHKLSENLNPRHAGARHSKKTRDSIIKGIREGEFKHYVDHSDALLAARKGFVYRAPSGHYVRQFLRVGNIQKSRQALDATFFWMLPFLKDRSTIIADTWSISSIAINAARLFGKYKAGQDCKVDFFSEYFDGSRHSRHNAKTLFQDPDRSREYILVLFSAVRSGKSLQHLQKALLENLPAADIKYLAIYKLDGGPDACVSVNALCTCLNGFVKVKRTGSVIRIDKGSFFPMTPKDKALNIRDTHGNGNYDFFRDYQGMQAFRIHRNVSDSSGRKLRHHAFDISVEALLRSQRFLDRFYEKLRSVPDPSVIVVPPHRAGERMGDLAKQFLKKTTGLSPDLVIHPDLDRQDVRLKRVKINQQKEILILDDVSITGQRLNRFQANLRSWNFSGHVTYLVGVARPDDEEKWAYRVSNLKMRKGDRTNDVECLEKIVLPDWDKAGCPWCMEYEWLTAMIGSSGLGEESVKRVIERREMLEQAADGQGLIENVFWIPSGQQRPTITPGSIFLPHVDATEADIAASVAGAIQRMRTDPDERLSLKADFLQPRVLYPDNFLGPDRRFNDLVLRMSVLRSALPSELRRWDDGDETLRSRYLGSAFVDDQYRFAPELTVAIAQGKFPLIEDGDVDLAAIQPPEAQAILRSTLKEQ